MFLITTEVNFAAAREKNNEYTLQITEQHVGRKKQEPVKTSASATGSSLTRVAQDEGYSIVAIRRVKHTYRRIFNHIATDKIVMEVAIELLALKIPFQGCATDFCSSEYFIIGDEVFNDFQTCSSGKEHCIELFLEPEQFEQVRNKSIVSFYKHPYLISPSDIEALKEMYKNGEPKEVLGIKFGRLHKKMIKQFPMVEMPVVTLH